MKFSFITIIKFDKDLKTSETLSVLQFIRDRKLLLKMFRKKKMHHYFTHVRLVQKQLRPPKDYILSEILSRNTVKRLEPNLMSLLLFITKTRPSQH